MMPIKFMSAKKRTLCPVALGACQLTGRRRHRQRQGVVKDGKIQVQNQDPRETATIVPCPNVEILVSGRKITQPEPLADTTPVQVHFPDEQPTVSYQVQVTQNGLEAQVTIVMRDGVTYSLEDTPPSESLQIRYSTSPVEASPSLESLLAALQEKGIVHGVDVNACRQACANRTSYAFVAARGEPYVPGRDGDIQFLVPMERIVDLPADQLQIDFRETVKLPDVKAGQVIAIKRDPVPGTPGKSVTGATLPPPKCKDPHFRAGKGVEIKTEQEGMQSAVATVSGVLCLPRSPASSALSQSSHIKETWTWLPATYGPAEALPCWDRSTKA